MHHMQLNHDILNQQIKFLHLKLIDQNNTNKKELIYIADFVNPIILMFDQHYPMQLKLM
jgi:hypothetical protein